MKKNTLFLGLLLIGLSIILHVIHFAIFQDLHHIVIYLLADIAFIPLEVFFVSLVLDKLIEKREHLQVVKKINMLVGLFYQELGNDLLTAIAGADENLFCQNTKVDFQWDEKKYKELSSVINNHNHQINIQKIDLKEMDQLINRYQQMITNLITNPSLQEHELFTDVLMSVFHLSEELKQRPLWDLSDHDYNHLKVDIERVYRNLSVEWVEYLQYLQVEYPYLFLSAISNNPFDSRQRADIEQEVLLSR